MFLRFPTAQAILIVLLVSGAASAQNPAALPVCFGSEVLPADMAAVEERLLGLWVWRSLKSAFSGDVAAPARNLQVTFDKDHHYAITQGGLAFDTGTWQVVPERENGPWRLAVSGSAGGYFEGFIVFCSTQVGFNAQNRGAQVYTWERTPGPRRVTGRVHPAGAATPGDPVAGIPDGVRPARGNIARLRGKSDEGERLERTEFLGNDGAFEFLNVPAGRYELTLAPDLSVSPVTIVVGERDVDVQLGLPSVRVLGSASVEDGGPHPPFVLQLVNEASPEQRLLISVAERIQAELPVGRYRLDAVGLPAGFTMQSASVAGNEVAGGIVTLGGAGIVSFDVTLRAENPSIWARVDGHVVSPASTGQSVQRVVLNGPTLGGPLTASVGSDGAFVFPKVLPGRYEIRTAPSPILLSRTVDVGNGGVRGLEIQPPTAEDVVGKFVTIAAGQFTMGCGEHESPCNSDERPAHRVGISRAFEMGAFEVTQAQWEAVMGANSSKFKGANRPVDSVGWADAQEFIARLNALGSPYRYRLPTEAEWEYASRGGVMDIGASTASTAVPLGWFSAESGRETHPVGRKKPNAWGLYDMLGNVQEWVEDWYGPYTAESALDPAGPSTGAQHVGRGGSFMTSLGTASFRLPFNRLGDGAVLRTMVNAETYGFRLVRERLRP